MPYVPTWKERLEDARPYVLHAVAAVIALALAGWLAWHQWGPKKAKPSAEGFARDRDESVARLTELKQVSALVEGLEKSYLHALETGVTEEAANLLGRTIERQRAALRLDPGVNRESLARLTRLEAARDALVASAAAARSLALEREVASAQLAGQSAGAAEKLREALRLQREANAHTATVARDFPREARLTQAIERAEAEPLHTSVETSLTLARAAAAQENWDDALKAFTEARTAQAEINQRFPTAPYSDLAALTEIDGEIVSLRAAGLAATVAAREREGDAAAKGGRAKEAAALYAAAADIQRQLNGQYGRSRFASVSRDGELAAKRDTVLASTLLERVAALDRETTAALARRQTVAAAEMIAAAAGLLEQSAGKLPSGPAREAALPGKLAFLNQHRADLNSIQSDVYARLVPVAGDRQHSMLRTELTQELFARVMDSNPSRHAGPSLPVDSVSWLEAQQFCQRLGWLMGVPVRLPTEAEIRASIGTGGGVWSADTSDGHSREAGQLPASSAGFHDLLGNVAEWLQSVDGKDETAPVVGGSYLDAAGTLASPPITHLNKRERARHIGFRVVVESALP